MSRLGNPYVIDIDLELQKDTITAFEGCLLVIIAGEDEEEGKKYVSDRIRETTRELGEKATRQAVYEDLLKEIDDIADPAQSGDAGLRVNFRHSLMDTFLDYCELAEAKYGNLDAKVAPLDFLKWAATLGGYKGFHISRGLRERTFLPRYDLSNLKQFFYEPLMALREICDNLTISSSLMERLRCCHDVAGLVLTGKVSTGCGDKEKIALAEFRRKHVKLLRRAVLYEDYRDYDVRHEGESFDPVLADCSAQYYNLLSLFESLGDTIELSPKEVAKALEEVEGHRLVLKGEELQPPDHSEEFDSIGLSTKEKKSYLILIAALYAHIKKRSGPPIANAISERGAAADISGKVCQVAVENQDAPLSISENTVKKNYQRN